MPCHFGVKRRRQHLANVSKANFHHFDLSLLQSLTMHAYICILCAQGLLWACIPLLIIMIVRKFHSTIVQITLYVYADLCTCIYMCARLQLS